MFKRIIKLSAGIIVLLASVGCSLLEEEDNEPLSILLENPGDGDIVYVPVKSVTEDLTITAEVTGYKSSTVITCYVDSTALEADASLAHTWTWVITKSDSGVHTIRVVGREKSGNEVEVEVQIEVVVLTMPSPYIYSPSDGTSYMLDDESSEMEVFINAGIDAEDIASMSCYIDDVILGKLTEPNYNWTWTATADDVGRHTIKVVAEDTYGNMSETSIQVNIGVMGEPQSYLVVNSTGDGEDIFVDDGLCADENGDCTLRAAIENANYWEITDSIAFDIPGAGPHTIQPTYALPNITRPLVIDGTTEPDYAGTPIIELDGSNAGDGSGIVIEAGLSTIRGLVVNRFNGNGIDLNDEGGNTVQGNYIGTDVEGNVDLGNGNAGIMVSSSDNLIGGNEEGARNIISGNLEGITFPDAAEFTNNRVMGNYIGTDATGTKKIANGVGILLLAPGNIIGGSEDGAGNIISGNRYSGISIEEFAVPVSGNVVQGNFIGTDASGTSALGNGDAGISIRASDNLVGGTSQGARNIISGNREGIVLQENPQVTGNTILGNYIGLDVTGTKSVGNTDGVWIFSSGNIIGGPEDRAGNIISGNDRYGIAMDDQGDAVSDNMIQGNLIGIDANGNALGNEVGIIIRNCVDNKIGGLNTNDGNVIAFNETDGIYLMSGTANAFLSNTIYGNSAGSDVGLGIELNDDGPTLNDVNDADTGPNNLQNYPDIASETIDTNGDVIVEYNVDSDETNSAYPITTQFFIADVGGEGKTLLGTDTYTTSDHTTGTKSINLGSALDHGFSTGASIVATATDADGNTSEFSTN